MTFYVIYKNEENKNDKQEYETKFIIRKQFLKTNIFTFPLKLTTKSRTMTCGFAESVAVSCMVNGPYVSLLELRGK